MWLIRYGSQLQMRHFYPALLKLPKLSQHQLSPYEYIQLFLKPYLRICTPFILLELRTRGKLPPWEGILLVKEHKVEGSDGGSVGS